MGGVNTDFTGGSTYVPITEQGATVQSGVVQTTATVSDSIAVTFYDGQLNPDQETLNNLNAGRPVIEFSVQTDSTGAATSVQANMWFSPNMMVSLAINLTEMEKQLSKARAAEVGAKVEAMNMIYDFAQGMATSILQAGQAESQMHMMEGVSGCLTMAGGIAGVGLAGANATGKFPNLAQFMQSGGGTALNSVISGLGQAVSGFVKAGLVLEKAEWEAYKEIQSAMKQLYSQILSSAQTSEQEQLELLKKTMDMLKQIWEGSLRAHNNFNPHG